MSGPVLCDGGALRWIEFTACDWLCFAGSERFNEGRQPLRASMTVEGLDATAVLDSQGLVVFWGANTETTDENQATIEGASAGRAAVLLRLEMTCDELRALGLRVER